MKLGIIVFLLIVVHSRDSVVVAQQSTNNSSSSCSNYFRSVRRAGLNMSGRLELPVDEQFPKFNVRMKFSRTIHHMTVRQLKAQDTGNHAEFIVDPMMGQDDGMLKLDTFIRLRQVFGPVPRLTRIIYNNRLICGVLDPNDNNDAIIVNLPSSSTTRYLPPEITSEKTNDIEEDEEVF